MKKIKAISILITCVISLALVFVSCDTFSGPSAPGGGKGGGTDDSGTATYTGTSGTYTYTLEIILASGGSVPKFGDGYELTAGSDRSTGTVATFGGGSFTLQPSVPNAPIFGATVTEFGLTGLTGIITVTDGTIRNSPGPLSPVSGPSSNNQGGKTYTVTFNANGGSGTAPSSQTVTAGKSITLPGPGNMSKSGYTFGGWNTNASSTGTNYSAGASYTVNTNATFYAKWVSAPVVTSYTVTFNANGASGSPPAAMTVTAGKSITLPGKGSLTKGNSTFEGWSDGSTTHAAGKPYTPTGSVTLSAVWSTSAPSNIVGTWICDQYPDESFVFNADYTGTEYYGTGGYPFTYTYSGNDIWMTDTYGDTFYMTMTSDTTIYKPWKYGEGYNTYTKQGSNSGPPPTLNGTWTKTNPETGITWYYIFNNGNFVEGADDTMDFRKGTYTTATGSNTMEITMTTTEIYYHGYGQGGADEIGWKNRSQLTEIWRQHGVLDDSIDSWLLQMGFNGEKYPYWIENRGGSVILNIDIFEYIRQ